MDRINASLIHSLLAKNIAFCLYRFPSAPEKHLALEPALFDVVPKNCFLIAPFVPASSAGEIVLHCVDNETDPGAIIQKINSRPDVTVHFPQLPGHTAQSDYMNRLEVFLKEIKKGTIQKAILSRVTRISKPDDFHPYHIFEKLCTSHADAFIYLLYHPESGVWIGATPELLLEKEYDRYATMALAGTQPANDSHHYTWQEKEIEEQRMVEEHVESVFAQHSFVGGTKNGPHTVEAGPVAHLCTAYQFFEKSKTDLRLLLKDLHPTPAVGGLPANNAAEFILAHEGYDRKYYCGFLGETDFEHHARLFINLRCMQAGSNDIAIYCGGGITADSDPEAEWEETIQKSRTMLDTLKERNEVVR